MKSLLSFMLPAMLFSAQSSAFEIPIVSEDNCARSTSRLMRCQYENHALPLADLAEYVPRTSELEITRSGSCSTQFPIQIRITRRDGTALHYNALQLGSHSFSQGVGDRINVEILAPYKNVAYFHSSCRITATLATDVIDIEQLTDILSFRKQETLQKIEVLDDRIRDKTTIATLLDATFALEQLVLIAEQSTVDLFALNDVLHATCDTGAECSWTAQIAVIVDDPNNQIPFTQQAMLFQLGQQLDVLLPSDCAENNCVAELIDENLSKTIRELRNTFDTTTLESSIRLLISERFELEDQLSEYRTIADDYAVEWNSL